jgi:16S rRNA (uracil1498-N3)-methyltransferase
MNASSERVELPEEEAEHLARVLRLRVGDDVEIFDGAGTLWRAEVVEVGKKSASVRRIDELEPAPELDVHLTLVFSVLKGDKNDDVVRDAVMLGATSIKPVVAERSEISMTAMARSNRVARWQRIAVASTKQCGRAVVPVIHDATPLDWYWAEKSEGARVMCLEPAAALGEVHQVQTVPKSSAIDLIVGPEGGWAVSEVAAAHDCGAILMSLGGRTLRADAVPIIAMTALLTAWGELK